LERIKKYFETITPLTEEDWKVFADRVEKRIFSKNDFVLKAGKRENYLSFIEKGILRCWLQQDEKEITFEFSFENSFSSAYASFTTQTPSEYNIQALTDIVLWSISYSDLQYVYENSGVGQKIGRVAAEELYMRKSKREISLLKNSAEQRYTDLLYGFPKLIQFIPLKYLASYIGITPQALSRIRKRIS